MIAMAVMDSTAPRPPAASRRHALLLGLAAVLAGCVARAIPPGPVVEPSAMDTDAFVMPDGMRLPYRAWLPTGTAHTVVLALHGFNDSRDAFEIPAPAFQDAGVALYAPDQRGFGATAGRGLWPGTAALVADAAAVVRLLRARHPGARLVLMGESMGGAVLMVLATGPHAPPVDGYVLLAPAVWGRARMNLFLCGALWLAATVVPGMMVSRPPPMVRIMPSDNRDALIRLSEDPLTIRSTRIDTTYGLVNLMDAAAAAARRFAAPALFLYGAHDDLIPADATRTIWAALPMGKPRCAYYPRGYHLLLRDLDRAVPIGDILAWLHDPGASLPSAADARATAWLAETA
jgi:acylglycerol lipase